MPSIAAAIDSTELGILYFEGALFGLNSSTFPIWSKIQTLSLINWWNRKNAGGYFNGIKKPITFEFQFKPLSQQFLYAWIGLSILIFVLLFFITAPYGRHIRPGWGPKINNSLGWVIMETVSLSTFMYLFLTGDPLKGVVNWLFFFLWVVHYSNRSFIFPLRQPNKKKKMPVLILVFAIFFNLVNGYINGYHLGTVQPFYPNEWFADPRFVVGCSIFISGFIINIWSDNILFRLRRKNGSDYKIPEGGLFRWVSCPNYLGEMLEWTGWAIATWSLPGLAFCIWTIANLLPRAMANHRWNKRKFEDYPKGRKAVIPGIF